MVENVTIKKLIDIFGIGPLNGTFNRRKQFTKQKIRANVILDAGSSFKQTQILNTKHYVVYLLKVAVWNTI